MSQEDEALVRSLFKICLLDDRYIKTSLFNVMHLFMIHYKPDYLF